MKVERRTFLKVSGGAVAAAAIATQLSPLNLGIPSIFRPQGEAALAPVEEKFVPTTCWIGKQDCGMIARVVDGRVVKFEGHPNHPRNAGTLCPKGEAQIMALYDPNRLTQPQRRTNEKGVSGQWQPISWDEALTEVGQEIQRVMAIDPSLILWQKGRSKQKDLYDTSFVKAIGATKLGHGAYCSDAGYRAMEYTIGVHGVLHPDFRYTRYLLAWGWNITGAGGNKFCWLTWPRQLLEAKEKGLKVIHIDPRLNSGGPFVDDWLPIKPGTDMALALAICHVLVEQGYIDTEYLTTYSNAPFLIQEDGFFYRVAGVEQVWDAGTAGPMPYDAPGVVPVLEGEFSISGETMHTAFTLFREHLASYTPAWAADICNLPADKINKVAQELGENALIGATIEIDGVEVPHRPVAIMAYHVVQQELGFQAARAMGLIGMLLGAFGAAGGQMIDFSWKIHKGYEGLENITIGDPPYNFYLKDSQFYPINTGMPGVLAKVMQDPEKYGVEELPEIAILHHVNPLGSFCSQKDFLDTYGMFKHVTVIAPWLTETADFFADIILPCATIEKYEGPISVSDQYLDAKTFRLPPMDPMGESQGEIDIYMQLSDKVGVLYGPAGFLDQVNIKWGLEGDNALPIEASEWSRTPTAYDIVDAWAQDQGLEGGIAYFETHGVWNKGPLAPTKRYGYATSPPFLGALHRLYGEGLLRYRQEMETRGVDSIYWQDYTPLPVWRAPTMDDSPSAHDLTLISYKLLDQKQSRTSFIPFLAELTPESRLVMNTVTAAARGIAEGDMVVVESHNAVTGETRSMTLRANLTEAIQPDTVGAPHHFGLWANPIHEGQGPNPNEVFYTGEGYTTNTADQSFHVKVKVAKAGGEI
ncbi:MAG: molybdopterin-dependent oxidoreductase [Candidatus Thermoplasmatota archaeon]|nr:molybdopterin-dependent oxidoreductase [Candidatus Thermoplasmatota archaeon]